jgi:type II secretory ATPase GspE/PulE/Tfp pilus assembly ATPase PilB-like protein
MSEEATQSEKQVALGDAQLAKAVWERLKLPMLEEGSTPRREWDLVNQGRLGEDDLLAAYAAVTGLEVLQEDELGELDPFPEVTYEFLTQWNAMPLGWDNESIQIAVSIPYSLGDLAVRWRAMFGQRVSFALLRRSAVDRLLTAVYETGAVEEESLLALGADASEEALRDMAREAPIVRLVNDIFNRAVEMGCSDIHVEPGEELVAVRYRVDGVLQTVQTPPISHYAAICSRIKLLGGMNIAERRLPQDGRIDLKIGRTEMDVRVSTVPTMHGESIVLRLLRKEAALFELDNLGLDAGNRQRFEPLITMPHGMILVVGPTGSGKTTTLYCVLQMLNSDTRKIITVEDPVEYQMAGVNQIQVRSQIGLTFSAGLRSIVRQDPDVILVGEIRDRETAEIAIHAALTGHLVLSTLHTNDAAGAISRLLEMGVESFLISSSLLGVLSQRLVRKVCPDCHGKGFLNNVEVPEQHKRCRNCAGSGYRGRVGIFELLVVNEELRRAINAHLDTTEINTIARRHGMSSLRENGEEKVRQGVTDAAEIARVCQLDLGI